MKSIIFDLSLGDQKEDIVIFREQEVTRFRQMIGLPVNLASTETGVVVEPQLLASRAFCGVADLCSGFPVVTIQQEVIFIESVKLGEELCLKAEVIGIEESRGWITFSLEAVNSDGNSVMAGQVVVSYDDKADAGKIVKRG
jgi:acyl dehydratase